MRCWGVQSTEGFILQQSILNEYQARALDAKIADEKLQLRNFSTSRPSTQNTETGSFRNLIPFGLFSGRETKSTLKAKLTQLQTQRSEMTNTIHTAESVLFGVLTVLPKTQGTTQLLDRVLMTDEDRMNQTDDSPPPDFSNGHHPGPGRGPWREREFLAREAEKEKEKRTATWIISTSMAFELVMISLAGWLFCRRDY